ncbi:unnamed protein product, partial [Prorocentrum cordatum]
MMFSRRQDVWRGNTLPRFASQARDFRSLRLSLDLAPPAAMVNEGPPTPEAVNAAMEDVPTTGPLASSYRRTLREMKKKGADVDPDGPVHFKLCGALKKLGLTKIDMRTFREWADRVTQFVKEEREVWLVQKEAFPDVGKDKKVSFWLLGPSEAQGVDHDRVWVLDAHAPAGPCMRGALRRTIGWKAAKDRGSKKPRLEDGDAHASGQSCGAEVAAGSGPAAVAQGMAPAPAALAAASSGVAPGGAEAAPERKRRKTPAEHVSSEDDDDVSIKTLRLDCQKACEAGRFYVPGETDTAHFRAKMYVGNLKKQKAEHMKRDSEKSFADELSVESRYFFQYLADWILNGEDARGDRPLRAALPRGQGAAPRPGPEDCAGDLQHRRSGPPGAVFGLRERAREVRPSAEAHLRPCWEPVPGWLPEGPVRGAIRPGEDSQLVARRVAGPGCGAARRRAARRRAAGRRATRRRAARRRAAR